MRLDALRDQGQSVWLDDLGRGILRSGELARLIDAGISGVTSNPSTFARALAQRDSGYAEDARDRLHDAPPAAAALYDALTIADVQSAADLLRPVWERTSGHDGLVSLEVSPRLAGDAAATLGAARYLWRALARPNVMIKVPGTQACLPAITALIGAGINVNVTLLFSPERHAAVMSAWIAGLEQRRREGRPVACIPSVASLFVSRIDAAVDARLDALAAERPELRAEYRTLRGRVAIALAAACHRQFLAMRREPRWVALEAEGAVPQRLLWASTGTKDPAARDTRYVESLVAPDTVTTLPRATLAAFLDHGAPAAPLDPAASMHAATMARLPALGIELPVIARELEHEGIGRFVQDHDAALRAIEQFIDAVPAGRNG